MEQGIWKITAGKATSLTSLLCVLAAGHSTVGRLDYYNFSN